MKDEKIKYKDSGIYPSKVNVQSFHYRIQHDIVCHMIQRSLLCLCAVLTLVSCSATQGNQGMTPLPTHFNDLSDKKLFEAITKVLKIRNAPPNSVYEHKRIDLNNDGTREAIVLFKLPHTFWCGWDGCSIAIFRPHDKEFKLVNFMNGIRGPLYVSHQKTKGWRDIILRLSGTNMRDKNVVMPFNGNSYPTTPLLAQDYDGSLSTSEMTKIFSY